VVRRIGIENIILVSTPAHHMLIAVTELNTRAGIDRMVMALAKAAQ